jgi:hypothetical protein
VELDQGGQVVERGVAAFRIRDLLETQVWPQTILLTLWKFSFSIIDNFSCTIRFTPPFVEVVMKWAYLKVLDLCLPQAFP